MSHADARQVVTRGKLTAFLLLAGLAVLAAAPAGAQTVSITSTPANGTHYVAGEHINTRISGLAQIFGAHGRWTHVYMALNLGGVTRQARITSTYSARMTAVDFRYTVTGDDFDADGIAIPANSISGASWYGSGFGSVTHNHAVLTNQANHKVVGSVAEIASSNPSPLGWGALHGATLEVELVGITFDSGAAASHFALSATGMPAVTGLSVSSVSVATTTAALTLSYTGSTTRSDEATLAVTVTAAAHVGSQSLTTNPVAILPPGLLVSPGDLSLTEGGAGDYSVALQVSGALTVTVTSDNPQIAVDTDATPLTRTLTFTTQNWNTAQTVTVRALADDADAVDERGTITNTAGSLSASVRVTVADDETKTGTDYDTDNDGLIEINSVAKLNAVRHDLDGNGSTHATYILAFPSAAAGMGCPDGPDADQIPDACGGYELTANLDFDTDGDGAVDSREPHANWSPIGGTYSATFEGNNHTISHLTMNASGHAGLFHAVSGTVRGLGLVDVSVSSSSRSLTNVGALAAHSWGTVVAVYVSGTVSATVNGSAARVGGLVGNPSGGIIKACYSTAAVSANASTFIYAGGLTGLQGGRVAASYVTGAVSASGSASAQVGGLAGATNNTGASVTNSYATGAVSSAATGSGAGIGGLVGVPLGGAGSASAAYWDRQTTGRSSSGLGTAQTTSGLKSPTAYGTGATDIYAAWDDYDTNGDGTVDAADDAWDFGQANQYPVLKWGGLSAAAQFAAQPLGTDTAPSYSGITVATTTYTSGTAIRPFQIPAPTGGNGTYDYEVTGLPDGLVFDEDGSGTCGVARTVCGAPSALQATTATVTVTVADADTNTMPSDRASLTFTVMVEVEVAAAVLVSPERLPLAEGAAAPYTAVLSLAPMDTVTVAVSSDNPAVTVATSSLTFTTRNWNTAQSVMVTALGDADAVDEAATITNAASGGGYDGVSASVRAVVDDDEATGTDHDVDNDGLIDVDSLAKLNAVRWDLDGDGVASSGTETSYAAAFAGTVAAEHMGCPDTDADADGDCAGYELTRSLTFDTDGDGDVDADDPNSYANWMPIGGSFESVFDGNGHVLSKLTVSETSFNAGLFRGIGAGGVVRSLGMVDASVSSGGLAGFTGPNIGILAGENAGTIAASYALGGTVAATLGNCHVGGLAGRSNGFIRASYATATVDGGPGTSAVVGGLAGSVTDGTIVASYADGAVRTSDAATVRVGGLVGAAYNSGAAITDSLCGEATGQTSCLGAQLMGASANYVPRQTTSELQEPTAATGIYANWANLDVDGDGTAGEEPWDFGSAHNHPALKYGGLDPVAQRNDYDADSDGLIEIARLAQLNAVRWDLDGDGAPVSSATSSYFSSATSTFFNAVFNAGGTGLACGADDNDCEGYELLNDLDFDTDGDGRTHTSGTGDDDDAYYNADNGWVPIGPNETPGAATHYRARFDGNGHVIDNLFVKRSRNYSGLFAALSDAAAVTSLGLPDAYVGDGQGTVGALAGGSRGRIAAVWSSGSVSANTNVGGLVGSMLATSTIVASYSTASVACAASGQYSAGASLAVVNTANGTIAASYATGEVTGACPNKHGVPEGGTVVASYWDTNLTGIADDADDPARPPEGRTTAVLQAPTDYDTLVGDPAVAIYAAWDDQDVDGDGATGDGDDADPWNFGLSNQHPILKYRGLAAAPQLDAQPDTAPTFGTSTVANMTFQKDVAIQSFQVPAASAGNGVLTYEQSGLPAGLSLGTPPCADARAVCGTPTATTTAPVTVTITVSDSDSNEEATDEGALTFTVEVVEPSAAISSPAALAEATLNNATVTVALTNAAFESGVTASSFTLNTTLSGLRIASLATVTAGDVSATLTLGYAGGFDTVGTLSVTVADAAHTLAGALTTPTVNIIPTPSVSVSRTNLTLTEGGASSTYAVVLGGQPTGAVTVTVTSDDDAAAAVDDTDGLTPGTQNTLSFTPTTWNTARTVSVSPQDDDDAADESVTINHAVSPGYGATAASVSVTVEDDETAAIVIDADPATANVDESGPVALTEGATSTTPYTVRLSAQPTGTVTVTVTSTDTGVATVDTDPAMGLQNTLTFTTGNWDTAQTAWLTPVDDTDPNNQEVAIDHAASNGGYNGVTARLRVEVADDDVGVIVDTDPDRAGDQQTPIALREGQTRTYRVRLSTLPAGNVTVVVTSSNTAITATPGSLAFNAGNWTTARTVTVRGEIDADAVGEWTDISNTANGGQYAGETTSFRATAQDSEMGGTDYDEDDDNLIEITTLARLNAVRWDLNGNGEVDSSANEADYRAAFVGSVMAEDMGCLDGPDTGDDGDCAGYELMADLDFDTDRDDDVDADDAYPNWAPIGGSFRYTGAFHGNNRTISNLTTSGGGNRGLFAELGAGGVVENLGLVDVAVSSSGGLSSASAGALAGRSAGTVIAVYVRGGAVSLAGGNGAANAGGLVGVASGAIRACYATAAVSGSSATNAYVGGLAGLLTGPVSASYATGAVAASGTGRALVGGLVGATNATAAVVTNSYATGAVSSAATGSGGAVGGLVGARLGGAGSAAASYWDSQTTGRSSSALGTTRTTSGLQTPTAYGTSTDIFAAWDDHDTNDDGTVDAADDAWDFGSAWNYPALKYGGLDVAAQRNNYDADGDGLIEISRLAQLNAVRWDLDGDGAPVSSATSTYFSATSTFFNALFNAAGTGLACPTTTDDADDNDCLGYELRGDLDFDTNGNGYTHTSGTGDTGDAYNNAGMGWNPIGPASQPTNTTHFNAKFDGNGKIIDNLYLNRSGRYYAGLFSGLAGDAEVVALGLPNAHVEAGQHPVGALVGANAGRLAAIWTSGSVTGLNAVGGLAGATLSGSAVVASYSAAAVACTSALVNTRAGGLVGDHAAGSIAASYSTGEVTGDCATKAGFAVANGGTVSASYWDTGLSQIADDTEDPPQPPEGKSTADLQAPTDYDTLVGGEAIYSAWDDQDVDGAGDGATGEDGDPWEFGLSNQHPILKYRGLAAAPQLDAQPDTAPTFGTSTVANMTFQRGRAIEAFQVPAASAGNGVLIYEQSGLPAGLSLGTPPCADARAVCGTPTATTTAPATVTITVSDSDSNEEATDEGALTFTVEVVEPSAAISSPAALAEATLNNATVTVALTNAAFEVGAAAANFTLTTNLPGLRVSSLATVSAGDTSATLTLGYSGGNFNTVYTLAVTVADAAHTLAGALATPTVNIVPTPSVAVSRSSLTLTEGGSDGTYTVVLGGQPTGNVAVTVTSTDANVATVDADGGTTGLQSVLSFTPTNWNTARTVTVSPQDDDDAVDGSATINHAVSPSYGATAASVSVTVEDDEAAAIVIDADPSTANVVDSGPIALVEGATSTTPYAVKLSAQPTGTVTVTVTSADTGVATVDTDPATGLQNTLSFTTGNWDTAQTAWLAPVDDTDPNSEEVDIRHEANGGGYNGVFAVLQANVADDDVGVIVDTDPNTPGDQLTALSLREGQTRTYRVRLSTLPAGGNVTVTATSSNAAITATPGSLTFNAGNWQTAQTVTVRAEQDGDRVGEWTDIANEANGAQYGGETTTVRATAEDDEMTGTDYDADGDFLIEIDSLAKLNAVRWDLGGDGEVDSSANEADYRAAFAGSVLAEDMGCLDGPDMNDDGDCAGYELMADLDFDTDGDGDVDADDDYPNWTPIGGDYNATFHGNNRAISNLTTTGGGERGLFWGLGGSSRVSNLGLVDVAVTATSGPSAARRGVGALAGFTDGTVEAVYVRGGAVSASYSGGARGALVGGLVGSHNLGVIRACYATAAVSGRSNLSPAVGGLVGSTQAEIVASYAAGAVHVHALSGTGEVGGLVGEASTRYSVFTNSYARGAVSATGSAYQGGLIGRAYNYVRAPASYWDSQTTGQGGSGRGTAQTTSGLQTPTSATGTFAAWDDHDTNGDSTVDAADEAWDFGSAYNYPALKYGGLDVAAQRNDYDADGDGLIEITRLAQLDAVRWDLDGDGAPAPGATSTAAYFSATSTFFNAVFNAAGTGLACPTSNEDADDNDCKGYELLNDLDFDTDGSGATHTSGTGDANDAWNAGGMGWDPIGPALLPTDTTHFNAKFDGNGKVIDNLFVNRSRGYSGLFAGTGSAAEIVALGLPDAHVRQGINRVGALAASNFGRVAAVWVSGSVAGNNEVGGLIGHLAGGGTVVASYSTAAVSCTNSPGGAGLVGNRAGSNSSIAASYSTGRVTGATCPNTAGFALGSGGTVAASYWDTGLSQFADDVDDPPRAPEGKSTADLQAPTDYDTLVGGEAIYATWDDQDVDGDGATGDGDDADPWDFGRPNQHPILKYRGLAAAPQLDAQPDTAPMFATSTLAAMTFPGGVAIQPFQLPAVTAGNGAYAYTPSGLPAGLSLGLPNCATARTVCGTPTAATTTTVTVTVDDSDSNQGAGDRDAVTFMVTVPPASARIASTTPPALVETSLNGASVVVELSGSVFDARIAPSGFQLATTPTIAGLSIASATRTSATRSTLRLRFDRTDFTQQSTLLVRVLAATHRFGGDQETGTVPVMPATQVALSATELTLEEAPGSTNANVGSYTVVLTGQPPSTATVTPASSNGDVTTSGALSFTTTSWNTPQTVTVTAGRDDDAVDDVAHITHAVQGLPGVPSGPRVRVTVNDDDSQGLTLDAATLTASGVTEGMTATYTAVLDSEPTGPVTVAISSSEGAVTVDADSGAAGAQNTLLFHAMNWNMAQTVTVRAVEDDDGEGGSATLTHDASGADYGEVADAEVSFAVTDNDAKGATLSTTALNVQENGAAEYTLVLDTQPAGGPVSVAVGIGSQTVATASPETLTFTAQNWDAPQTVTVAGVDDANTGNEIVAFTHTPTGGGYDGVSISNINVTAVDDDVAGLKVSPVNLTVAEGATATYTVRLNVAPAGTTTVTVGGATAKLTADTDTGTPGDQTTLAFDAANWDTARTVTVTGVPDADGADETAGLSHTVTGTGDYASLAAIRRPGVDVRVRDDEAAGVVLAPMSLAIDEGGTATYEVSLSAPPASGTTTIAIAAAGAAGLTVDASTLSFTGTTWDTARTVTVTAVADHDRLTDAEGVLTHAVSGYGAVESGPDLPVRVANTTVDHDADADGLIEINSLAKLNAMRWDLDGDGTSATTSYAAVFPNARGGGVCPTATSGVACDGFELTTDLDFDTDGDGRTWTEAGGVLTGDDGDDYDNGGAGWEPVGADAATPFAGRFDGNGRIVRNLFVNQAAANYRGLFGVVSGRLAAVGLANARVRGAHGAGALVGFASAAARVTGAWSTGAVSGDTSAGGLVGRTQTGARIAASYSTAAVECRNTASGYAGGLAGGGSSGTTAVSTSWSAGAVTGACPDKAGLIGERVAATASWWDAAASGIPDDADLDSPEGRGTSDLQTPTGYTDLYANWNVDLDGDYEADDPWDFGSSSQYPSLKWRGFDVTQQFVGLLSFASGVSGRSFTVGRAIALFEVPAAVGGEGTVRYAARGLPPGLWFDANGRGQCGLPRSVCGTPSQEGSWTATVTARDGAGATAALTFQVAVVAEGDVDAGPPAAIADAALREAVARTLGVEASSLTEADLLALSSLSAAWSGVSSLAGLSAASNLRRLELGGNAVADLSELSGLRLLEHLDRVYDIFVRG